MSYVHAPIKEVLYFVMLMFDHKRTRIPSCLCSISTSLLLHDVHVGTEEASRFTMFILDRSMIVLHISRLRSIRGDGVLYHAHTRSEHDCTSSCASCGDLVLLHVHVLLRESLPLPYAHILPREGLPLTYAHVLVREGLPLTHAHVLLREGLPLTYAHVLLREDLPLTLYAHVLLREGFPLTYAHVLLRVTFESHHVRGSFRGKFESKRLLKAL